MLIYTHALEKYILNKILPILLLNKKKYKLKGSFKRKIPYVTDIDVVNYVNPEINRSNIYSHILKLLEIIKLHPELNIKLVYVTCGTDDRFKLITASPEELSRIWPLLKKKEKVQLSSIMEKYKNDSEKKLFYTNEIIWPIYKLRWRPEKILQNEMKLRGNKIITFDSVIQENCKLLIQYFVNIKSIPIGVDMAVYYDKVDCVGVYDAAAKYNLKLANYGNDYYYMLFPFKYYFRSNPKIRAELEYIIEKKFGLYKQLMVRIDTYNLLYASKNLDIETAKNIVVSIIQDIRTAIPDLNKSHTLTKIKKVAENNTMEYKIREWNTLLDALYDEILTIVNDLSKNYFLSYIKLVPDEFRSQCCIGA